MVKPLQRAVPLPQREILRARSVLARTLKGERSLAPRPPISSTTAMNDILAQLAAIEAAGATRSPRA